MLTTLALIGLSLSPYVAATAFAYRCAQRLTPEEQESSPGCGWPTGHMPGWGPLQSAGELHQDRWPEPDRPLSNRAAEVKRIARKHQLEVMKATLRRMKEEAQNSTDFQ
jgi:hypothetical protein